MYNRLRSVVYLTSTLAYRNYLSSIAVSLVWRDYPSCPRWRRYCIRPHTAATQLLLSCPPPPHTHTHTAATQLLLTCPPPPHTHTHTAATQLLLSGPPPTHTITHTHTHTHTHTQLLLSDNRLSGGLDNLARCNGLKKLVLAGNKISNLEELKPLVRIYTPTHTHTHTRMPTPTHTE